jgi:hypothetical protein
MKQLLFLLLLLTGCHDNSGKCTQVDSGRTLPALNRGYAWIVTDENGLEGAITIQNSNEWRCVYNN